MTAAQKTFSRTSPFRNYLGEIIYGGNDGIITTFAVVSGFSGAAIFSDNTLRLSIGIVLLFGFANLFSDALSMGIGNYLSKRAQSDALKSNATKSDALKTSLATFIAFITFGGLPLLPYIIGVADPKSAFTFSILTTFLALLLLGLLKGIVIKRKILASIIETTLIGGLAALVAFLVGVFFKV